MVEEGQFEAAFEMGVGEAGTAERGREAGVAGEVLAVDDEAEKFFLAHGGDAFVRAVVKMLDA